MGLQSLRLQSIHIIQTQARLVIDRRIRGQIRRQLQGQLLRQRLWCHAHTDALPQSL